MRKGSKMTTEQRKNLSMAHIGIPSSRKIEINKTCGNCSAHFIVSPSRKNRIYCSATCSGLSRIGNPSWNKGLIGFRKGEKHPWMPSGKDHWSFKGGSVGYRGLHLWVEKELGRPMICDNCGDDTLAPRKYQWANKSREYKRTTADWTRLCAKCHFAYDRRQLVLR